MKINCGPTWEEKCEAKDEYLSNWHRFFAIWPRRVGPNDCRFLEFIERKGTSYIGTMLIPEGPAVPCKKWRWEFRAIEK